MSGASAHLLLRTRNERLALRLPVRGLAAAAGLALGLFAVFGLGLLAGSYGIGWREVLASLAGAGDSAAVDNVVWSLRLPRSLVATLAGAMMAVSGAVLQSLTRNGLADPSLVGISQGAALAVVTLTVTVPGVPMAGRPFAAFAGSLAAAALVQALSGGRRGSGGSVRFILMGIGVSTFIGALTSALLTYGDIDRAMSALAWLAGSINAANWGDAGLLAAGAAILLLPVLGLSRAAGALRMGEAAALGLGVRVAPVRLALLAAAVGLAAVPTCVVGPLGFVGLIAPHAAARMGHAGPGLHLVLTALTGALLVSLADLVGRTAAAPIQIPAGLITALIGVPLFIWLLGRARAAAA